MCQAVEDQNLRLTVLKLTMSSDTVRLEIPEVSSEYHRLDVVGDLYELCQYPPAGTHWVIDFSQLRVVGLSFLGVLVALAHELEDEGRAVRFTGLDAGMLPPRLAKKLIRWLPDDSEPSSDEPDKWPYGLLEQQAAQGAA